MACHPVALLLINARKNSLLTQAQVAERAGTSQSAVVRYEKGLQTPSVDTLQRLLKANGFELILEIKKAKKVGAKSELYKIVQANRGEIREILHSLGARNIRIVGSVARGEDDKESDLDLLVDIDKESGNTFKAVLCAKKISKIIGRDVDILPSWLCKKEVLKSVLSDAIPL
jgi:predicted nucleotidyltransferase/DNA-binding XRE family transcriptional regulator